MFQNPKSKIPKIPKSKIQNPQKNPQNPQNPKSPKSKIQKSPKSKILNPQLPKSKILNPRQNPKFGALGPHIKNCYITIQNPKSKIPNPNFFGQIWGFWILDLGFRPQNPKSKLPKIQNPKSPKSSKFKIPNPQNPKSKIPKIQNPKSPKSSAEIQNLGRWGPHVKNCFIMIQNPKSKIPKIRPKKFGFWILGILDFDFWDFGFWIVGILDFGFWDFGDFRFWGFWGFWILDFGDFGFWILGILGILDFGDFGFWILDFRDFGDFGFWILGFWGGPGDVPLGNLATVPGGQRLESPLVCLWGPLQNQLYLIELGQESKLSIFSEVRTLQNHRKTQTSNPLHNKSRRAQWSHTKKPPKTQKVELPFFPKKWDSTFRSVLVLASQQFQHLKCSWCFPFLWLSFEVNTTN